jgi:hypothetical protein
MTTVFRRSEGRAYRGDVISDIEINGRSSLNVRPTLRGLLVGPLNNSSLPGKSNLVRNLIIGIVLQRHNHIGYVHALGQLRRPMVRQNISHTY